MLKNLSDATAADLKCFMANECVIYEKLDTFYFNVMITMSGCTVLKSNHRIIDDVDMAVNSMYSDITAFVRSNIAPAKDKITERYGDIMVGIFYFPCEKPGRSDYTGTNMPGSFVIGNVKMMMTEKHIDDVDYLAKTTGMLPYPVVVKIPAGKFTPDLIGMTPAEIVEKTGGGSFSGLDMNKAEGIVIKSKCKTFQVLNDRPEKPDEYQKKIDVYDDFVKHLCEWYILSDHDIRPEGGYISNITNLFVRFTNENPYIKEFTGNPDDLTPSINTYTPEPDYSIFPDETVKTICKCSRLAANIFKIMLHGLRYHKNIRKSSCLSADDFLIWNKMVDDVS